MRDCETDKEYAKSIIDNEGIGYAVRYYCRADTFKNDSKLRELWQKAADALDALENYVNE